MQKGILLVAVHLVGGGLVDIAIGADQGGSIRVPSSFCGCELQPMLERSLG
jgi:hypothetical protein